MPTLQFAGFVSRNDSHYSVRVQPFKHISVKHVLAPIMKYSILLLIASVSLVVSASRVARAEISIVKIPEEDDLEVIRLTVTPAAAPMPAFKYRLVTPDLDLHPGNAAPFYYRAFIELSGPLQRTRKDFGEDEFDSWIRIPLGELPLDKVRKAESQLSWIIDQHIVQATSLRNCDWQLNVESLRGPDTISFLLPEFQESRQLGRLLLLRTRLQIAERRYQDAIDTMRMNYRLAVDTANVPLFVCGLVGIAEAELANGALRELIAQPDSPNMYWALAELPQPLVELGPAMRFEMGIGPRIFPFIHHAESTERAPEEWNRLYREAVQDFAKVGDTRFGQLSPHAAGVVGTGYALVGYPHAKRWLIEQGFDREHVEQMAVGQVIAIYSERIYQQFADELETLWYMPFWESRIRQAQAYKQLQNASPLGGSENREILPIADSLLPALVSARGAQVRLEREIAAMQVIEALRMYAAAHDGKLPESLDDIHEVPVPMNPATGKSFEYRLDEETAIIALPPSDGLYPSNRRFEIRIADQSNQ